MKDVIQNYADIINVLVAGLSGGIIRIRMMLMKNEKLSFSKVGIELATAGITSYYIGDMLVNAIPFDVSWSDNFVYFISGYGGMSLVDAIYRKYIKNNTVE